MGEIVTNYHRKFVAELRFTISPTFFDVQGKLIISFWPDNFKDWEKVQDHLRLFNKSENTFEAMKLTHSNLVYSIEGDYQASDFKTRLNRHYKKFSDFQIANIFTRIGVRTFTCFYDISFDDIISRSNDLFQSSGLLIKLGNNFIYEDFAIILEGEENRVTFGGMKAGEKHAGLNNFDLLSNAPEDLLYIDVDYGKKNVSGITNTKDTVKQLLEKNIEISQNLAEYFGKEL